MESLEGAVKIRYKFNTTVKAITKEKLLLGARVVNGETVMEFTEIGWFILLHGSGEKLYIGEEQPLLEIDDHVTVTIEKIHAAAKA